MDKCRDWIIAVRLGCLVIVLTSSLQINYILHKYITSNIKNLNNMGEESLC